MLAAAQAGIPTVLAPGCVDMCNFWGIETVPEKYQQPQPVPVEPQRHADAHQRGGESSAIGRDDRARPPTRRAGPVTILLPLKGVSQLDSPGEHVLGPGGRCCVLRRDQGAT